MNIRIQTNFSAEKLLEFLIYDSEEVRYLTMFDRIDIHQERVQLLPPENLSHVQSLPKPLFEKVLVAAKEMKAQRWCNPEAFYSDSQSGIKKEYKTENI